MPSNDSSPPSNEPPAFHLTAIDAEQISLPDSAFTPHSWSDLKSLVSCNRLEELKRFPSSLRAYLAWSAKTKKIYGSITNFLVRERLGWVPVGGEDGSLRFEVKSAVPFEEPGDYKILLNDWPYGLAPGIRHIVVWLKRPLEVDAVGELVPHVRAAVEGFVEKTFRERVREFDPESKDDKVIWFKNTMALQSVRSLEHFHVLVRDVQEETVRAWVT
jgi:hypothetical protein